LIVQSKLGQLCNVGESGELYLGGSCLSRGYLGRPDLTAERFVPDPFSAEAGARLYRTGDLVRWNAVGELEFVGRADDQVKIRGFRVELGEIESALRSHPSVREAVVLARASEVGERRLVGYVVAGNGANQGELREYLRSRLPEYMVPAAFVMLEKLPLTPNGKVDRRALPAPDGDRVALPGDLVEPRTPTEKWLVETWQAQLGIGKIGIRDNFFEIGGHSLMAVRIFDLIHKEKGRSLSPATLFHAPTIEALAAILDQEDWTPDWKCLVAIRPNGSRPPFFIIHGAQANVLFCEVVARYLPDEIPLFGVQSLGLDGKTEPLTRVEEMADLYLSEIRSVQPEGPYYLGGLSFGGILALEIAQRLMAEGQKVAILAMLNSECPVLSPHFEKRSWLFERRLIPWLLHAEHNMKLVRQLGAREFLRHKTFQKRQPFRDPAAQEAPDEPPISGLILGRIFTLNRTAERIYRPRPYPGRITLFYATERHPYQYNKTDTRLGWDEFAGDGLEVHLVPGNHGTMRREPHIRVLAAKLTSCLNRAYEASSR
jgi:thioesterase domain-containing protein